MTPFLVYDYYYEIRCPECNEWHPALDYAEFAGIHPIQTGEMQQETVADGETIWHPSNDSELKEPTRSLHAACGVARLESLCSIRDMVRLDSLEDFTPESTWNKLAETWIANWPEGGDYHHKNLIIPSVLEMLDAQPDERILDVACGEGTIARHLASKGAKVVGIDLSRMLDYAARKEKDDPKGIEFIKMDVAALSKHFAGQKFDKAVCSMALMDMADLNTALREIAAVLKSGGVFVLSIIHPCLAFPTLNGLRLPRDSERNEDLSWVLCGRYFDTRPALFKWPGVQSRMLQFHRPISDYVNALAQHGLFITHMREPSPSATTRQQHPKQTFKHDERKPNFLIVKTRME